MKSDRKSVIGIKQKGFTLIEVVISVALLAILAVALLSMFSSSYSNVFSMGRKTSATNRAQAFLEAVYKDGLANIGTVAASADFKGNPVSLESYLLANSYDSQYQDKVLFYHVDTNRTPNKLMVIVFYQNGNRNVKLSTLIP